MSTHKTTSKPSSPPEKPSKTDDKKKKDKDKDDGGDEEALQNAISTYSIMMLQKILQGAKRRRAEMNEDDPDAF